MRIIDNLTPKRSCEITMVLLLMALAWSVPFALVPSYKELQVMGVILFGTLSISIMRDESVNTQSPIWRKIIVMIYSVFIFGVVLYIMYSDHSIETINLVIQIVQYIIRLSILILVIYAMVVLIKYYRNELLSPKEWSKWLMTSRIGHYLIMLTIGQKVMQTIV